MTTVTFYNLGFLLVTFLGLNLNTNISLDQLLKEKSIAETEIVAYTNQADFDGEEYAVQLAEMGIILHPDVASVTVGEGTTGSLKHCESLAYQTLKSLPVSSTSSLKNLTLSFEDGARRGLGGGSTVILRCTDMSNEELVSVLVHEMGHITDTGALKGTAGSGESAFMDGSNPVYNDDPSLSFYGLSFENDEKRREDAIDLDFVSGYAQTDPFEDFAESYNYYILHGEQFRQLTKYNATLAAKYDFLKNTVFKGKEYDSTDASVVDIFERQYDVTVLPYEMNKFFL